MVLVVLGGMHFFNLFFFNYLRKRSAKPTFYHRPRNEPPQAALVTE
jgi:hypothetical protein